MELMLLLIGVMSGAVTGFIVCCWAITALNPPPPRNERRHSLGRLLVVSHPDWRNQ